jgi:hypothetical protein
LTLEYELMNSGNQSIRCLFISEWNLNLPHHDATIRIDDGGEHNVMLLGELSPISQVRVEGGDGVLLKAQTTLPVRLWRFPIETVSNSEGGLERSRQGVCLAFVLELGLDPGESLRWDLSWEG